MCLILGLLASVFVIPFALAADKPSTAPATKAAAKGEHTKTLGDALDRAYKYTFDTGGIGIVMSYGKKNGATADAIGEAFVNELLQRGYKSKYYYYNTERDGVALSFRIGHSSLGPWAPNLAAQKINEVTARADAAYKIHGKN